MSPLGPVGPVEPVAPVSPLGPVGPVGPVEPATPASPVVFFTLEPTKIKSPLESVRFSAYKPSPKSIRKPLTKRFSAIFVPIGVEVLPFAPPV